MKERGFWEEINIHSLNVKKGEKQPVLIKGTVTCEVWLGIVTGKSVSCGNLVKMKRVELNITYLANTAHSFHRTLANLFKQWDEQARKLDI
jgi:hypothetical protein